MGVGGGGGGSGAEKKAGSGGVRRFSACSAAVGVRSVPDILSYPYPSRRDLGTRLWSLMSRSFPAAFRPLGVAPYPRRLIRYYMYFNTRKMVPIMGRVSSYLEIISYVR